MESLILVTTASLTAAVVLLALISRLPADWE